MSIIFLEVLTLESYYFTDWNSSSYNIRKYKIYYFKEICKSIMAAQIRKKNCQQKIFCILECLLSQNPLNRISQLSWFFQTIWKTVRKYKKQEAIGNYFCLKTISKTAPQKNFQKKKFKFWRPGNQPKTWNSDLNFFAHGLLHINSI